MVYLLYLYGDRIFISNDNLLYSGEDNIDQDDGVEMIFAFTDQISIQF